MQGFQYDNYDQFRRDLVRKEPSIYGRNKFEISTSWIEIRFRIVIRFVKKVQDFR